MSFFVEVSIFVKILKMLGKVDSCLDLYFILWILNILEGWDEFV